MSEKASVGLLHQDCENSGAEGVELGRGVVVEPAAVVEARLVGEGTVVEAGARVGRGAVIGKVGRVQFLSVLMDLGACG